MTTAKKSMGPKRKGKKQYSLVTFKFEPFEGEFTMPKLGGVPIGILSALDEGEMAKFRKFLDEYAPGTSEAFMDMDSDELGDFMKEWSEASGDDTGKSTN
jgi:hypothetical protein